MMQIPHVLGMHPEAGPLRQAIVHRPGLELSRLTPTTATSRPARNTTTSPGVLHEHGGEAHHFDTARRDPGDRRDARVRAGAGPHPELVGPPLAGPLRDLAEDRRPLLPRPPVPCHGLTTARLRSRGRSRRVPRRGPGIRPRVRPGPAAGRWCGPLGQPFLPTRPPRARRRRHRGDRRFVPRLALPARRVHRPPRLEAGGRPDRLLAGDRDRRRRGVRHRAGRHLPGDLPHAGAGTGAALHRTGDRLSGEHHVSAKRYAPAIVLAMLPEPRPVGHRSGGQRARRGGHHRGHRGDGPS